MALVNMAPVAVLLVGGVCTQFFHYTLFRRGQVSSVCCLLASVPGTTSLGSQVLPTAREVVHFACDKYIHFVSMYFQENERTKDLIIEQRFHRTIIGQKGERIREIRDKFPEVVSQQPYFAISQAAV